jgi:hypothetical protein
METVVDVKVLPMGVVSATEFTLIWFWIELRQFIVGQKYHSLECLYKFCSLVCSALSVSSKYISPI